MALLPTLRNAKVHTAWFIGDSVLMQVAFAWGCRARVESRGVAWQWRRPPWAFLKNEKAAGGVNCASHATQPHRVCFITAVAHGKSPSLTQTLRALMQRQLTRSTDIAIVMGDKWNVENVTRQEEYAEKLLDLVRQAPPTLPRVIHFESLAAHFPTRDGWWQPGLGDAVKCRALQHPDAPPMSISAPAAILRRSATPAGLTTVEGTYAWSAGLAAAHPGPVPGKPSDCTHYCLSSGVADALVTFAAHALARSYP